MTAKDSTTGTASDLTITGLEPQHQVIFDIPDDPKQFIEFFKAFLDAMDVQFFLTPKRQEKLKPWIREVKE